MLSCSSSNPFPLFNSQCSLPVTLPQCSISFPLHLIPSFYSCPPPPPPPPSLSFPNPWWKKQRSALKIFQGGRRALAEAHAERWRGTESKEQKTGDENTIWCSPGILTENAFCLLGKKKKKVFRALEKQSPGCYVQMFIICRSSLKLHSSRKRKKPASWCLTISSMSN